MFYVEAVSLRLWLTIGAEQPFTLDRNTHWFISNCCTKLLTCFGHRLLPYSGSYNTMYEHISSRSHIFSVYILLSFNIKLKYSNIKIAKIKYFVGWASTKLIAVNFITRNTDLSLRHDISFCTQSHTNITAAYYWDSETPGIHPHCKTLEYTSTSTPTSTSNIRIQVNNNYCHTRGILHQSIPIVLCHVWSYFHKK